MKNKFDILLSDPDISEAELEAVARVLQSPRLSQGAVVEEFEHAFATSVGRRCGVAVSSGTLGLLLTLNALRIGSGDEVIVSPYSWHQIAHAVTLAGAKPVFVDIDYWSGTLAPDKIETKVCPATRAIVASNVNGHPASWDVLRPMASRLGLTLIEDSTEAIGSRYQSRLVGSFGDCSIFDFSQPGVIVCGEGGMVVTDDEIIAARLRAIRNRRLDERFSVVAAATVPLQAGMSEIAAALGLAQLARMDGILERRKTVEGYYFDHVKSFEGIKDPYVAPEVNEVHWALYLVHLGTRFTRSSRDAIVEDLRTAGIEAVAFCQPLHRQPVYRGASPLFVTEKVADRVLALPLHAHLSEDQVAFIVQTAKDASVNVGAGAAIYL